MWFSSYEISIYGIYSIELYHTFYSYKLRCLSGQKINIHYLFQQLSVTWTPWCVHIMTSQWKHSIVAITNNDIKRTIIYIVATATNPKSQDDQIRDHTRYGLSQWETTLHCNVVSHWLSHTHNYPWKCMPRIHQELLNNHNKTVCIFPWGCNCKLVALVTLVGTRTFTNLCAPSGS